MAVRLNFIVEGQTEESFVNHTLRPHLAAWSIWANARCVMTSKKDGVTYRGGLTSYLQAKRDIVLWIREDDNSDARFTTMFDLYRLPKNFPGYKGATQVDNPFKRVTILEDALRTDIPDPRFIPYFQIHEFEALLLSQPQELDSQFYDSHNGIRRLAEMVTRYDSPELINDGIATAPSKRIISEIPEYEGRKASAGPIVAGRIGLPTLRSKCGHFGDWLDKLERLG